MNLTEAPGEGRAEAALFSHSKYSLASLLIVERLYRIRHLHRGTHPVRSAEELCRLLWLGLSRPLAPDSS
jgi:hypothetical protein